MQLISEEDVDAYLEPQCNTLKREIEKNHENMQKPKASERGFSDLNESQEILDAARETSEQSIG